jgi:hypothetical protein
MRHDDFIYDVVMIIRRAPVQQQTHSAFTVSVVSMVLCHVFQTLQLGLVLDEHFIR